MDGRKRTVNNNRSTIGNWHPDIVMNALERDSFRIADDTMKKARKWFNRPSYYQTEEGSLAGGMKRKCDLEG